MKSVKINLLSVMELLEARKQWSMPSLSSTLCAVEDKVPATYPRPFEVLNIDALHGKIKYYHKKWSTLKGGRDRKVFRTELSKKELVAEIVCNETALEERVSELEEERKVLQENLNRTKSDLGDKIKLAAAEKQKTARAKGNANRLPGKSPSTVARAKRSCRQKMEEVSPPNKRYV